MTTSTRSSRATRRGPLPLRIYIVLKYLRALLTPGQPASLSNAALKVAVGYGSEGEISQIMRWLAGELPTVGRWAYRYLDMPQQLRYIRRERRPDGGYATTLLGVPEPIALADHQDPLHDPLSSASECAAGGIMQQDPPLQLSFWPSESEKSEIQGDLAIESRINHDQEEESCAHEKKSESESESEPLYRRLMDDPNMAKSLARRIAANPPGGVAEFELDLELASEFARSPFYFTVARWRDGQRVTRQEPRHDRSPAAHQPRRPSASAYRIPPGTISGRNASWLDEPESGAEPTESA